MPAERVAANVERYVRAIRARPPLGLSGDPLRHLSASAARPARPRFPSSTTRGGSRTLKTHFYRNVILKVVPDWWRRLVQSMIRIGKQLKLHRVLQRSRLIRVGGLRPLLGAPAGQGGTAAWPTAAGCDAAGPGCRRHVSTPTSASSVVAPSGSDPRLPPRRGGAGSVLVIQRGEVQPSRALFGEDEVEQDREAVRRRCVPADRGLPLHDPSGGAASVGAPWSTTPSASDPPQTGGGPLERSQRPERRTRPCRPRRKRRGQSVRLLDIHRQDEATLNPSGPLFVTGATTPPTPGVLTQGVVDAQTSGELRRLRGLQSRLCLWPQVVHARHRASLGAVNAFPGSRADRVRVRGGAAAEALTGHPERVVDARATLA